MDVPELNLEYEERIKKGPLVYTFSNETNADAKSIGGAAIVFAGLCFGGFMVKIGYPSGSIAGVLIALIGVFIFMVGKKHRENMDIPVLVIDENGIYIKELQNKFLWKDVEDWEVFNIRRIYFLSVIIDGKKYDINTSGYISDINDINYVMYRFKKEYMKRNPSN